MKKCSLGEFINRARIIHGNKYDYSKVEYKNTRSKIVIICPEHGEFTQTPNSHTNYSHAQGCPKWGQKKKSLKLRKTTECFVNKSNKVHNNRYDYSQAIYKGKNIKVIITCQLHGDFLQTFSSHIYKRQGCPKCARNNIVNPKKLTITEFIKRSNKAHNNKYDYSKVIYKNILTKVKIICPVHGLFNQIPNNHLRGSGCPYCAPKGKLPFNTEKFVKKAVQVHGNLYQYNKVVYKTNDNKVIINCKIHGDFEQIAGDHLKGRGCPLCNGKIFPRLTLEEFLQRSNKTHNNKYDYSSVHYLDSRTKVKIKCPEHGYFFQNPVAHYKGLGCIKCKKSRYVNTFLKKAQEIHNDKYDYSKTVYNHSKKDIVIICPKHGEFLQKAYHHLEGHGCQKCQRSLGEELIEKWLIENNIKYKTQARFQDCRGKRNSLPFDFYLPYYDICIEYDGPQHYSENFFFIKDRVLAKKKLQETKKNDLIKTKYCLEKGIRLIRLKAFKRKEKIHEHLVNIFKELK